MAKYVESIYIEEFRGIRRLKEPLNLTGFNVVIGRNNTGKTALLEALYLISPSWGGYLDPILRENRIAMISKLHGGASSLIYGYSGLAKIQYVIEGNTITTTLSASGIHEVQFNDKKISYKEYIKLLAENLNMDEDHISYFTFLIPNSTSYLHTLHEAIRSEWNEFVKLSLHRRIVRELINPVVYDTFTEVLIERNELKLRKELGEDIGPLYIHVSDLGDGIERICLVALALEYANPSLVLWDDIEVAAHPGLIEGVLKWLASKKWQVVVTTHSIDVLYTLVDVNPPEAQVILLRKTKDDVVKAKTFTLDEIEELLEKNIDPRKIADVLQL